MSQVFTVSFKACVNSKASGLKGFGQLLTRRTSEVLSGPACKLASRALYRVQKVAARCRNGTLKQSEAPSKWTEMGQRQVLSQKSSSH